MFAATTMFVIAASMSQTPAGSMLQSPAASAAAPIAIDLTRSGIPAVITVPAGTKFWYAHGQAFLDNAPRFHMTVFPSRRKIAKEKALITADKANKLKRWITDAPDVLVYESASVGSPMSEFHFIANVSLGKRTVACEATKGSFLKLADVEAMLAACRTLVPAPGAAAPATGRKGARPSPGSR